MIDINKLRKLAKAATPGRGWYVELGDYIYGEKDVTDGEEWQPVIVNTEDGEPVNFEGSVAAFIAAANPTAMIELLDRLEAAENDALEQARLNGIGAEKELALMAKLEAAAKERDALRIKVERMEKQEPVGVLHVGSYYGEELQEWEFEADQRVCDRLNERHVTNPTSLNLYALPGAQPAPGAPWVSLAERMPNPDKHDRVLIYTEGYDFGGEQVFDVKAEALNECRYIDPDEQPETCKAASHWMPHPRNAMFDYAAHSPTPSVPDGWLRAIDDALVVAHIGVANSSDTYGQARTKLDNLINFHIDVATDPAVNGGWKLVPIEPTPVMKTAGIGVEVYQDSPPSTDCLTWGEVEAIYSAMIAAAPEMKP